MSGSVKHQAEPMCKASSGTAQRPGTARNGPVRTFFTSSRAPAAPAAGRPGSAAGSAGCWAIGAPDRRGIHRHRPGCWAFGGHRAAASPRPFGREPYGRGGCRRTAGPHPAATGAPPSAGGHACKNGPTVPLAPGILSPSKVHRQGARLRRVAAQWRKRHPLSSDLPRRTSAPIEGDGGMSRLP
jgi:hypothetical protein